VVPYTPLFCFLSTALGAGHQMPHFSHLTRGFGILDIDIQYL
jgi:hypothetical protein